MSIRLRIAVLLPMALVLTAVGVGYALAAGSTGRTTASGSTGSTSTLAVGKALYRKFCGQCHALSQADAAGFGSDSGLGQDGGPSFNNLKIPYDLSIQAVTGSFVEHEVVVRRITYPQLDEVSAFLAFATKHNPYLARESDG